MTTQKTILNPSNYIATPFGHARNYNFCFFVTILIMPFYMLYISKHCMKLTNDQLLISYLLEMNSEFIVNKIVSSNLSFVLPAC